MNNNCGNWSVWIYKSGDDGFRGTRSNANLSKPGAHRQIVSMAAQMVNDCQRFGARVVTKVDPTEISVEVWSADGSEMIFGRRFWIQDDNAI